GQLAPAVRCSGATQLAGLRERADRGGGKLGLGGGPTLLGTGEGLLVQSLQPVPHILVGEGRGGCSPSFGVLGRLPFGEHLAEQGDLLRLLLGKSQSVAQFGG